MNLYRSPYEAYPFLVDDTDDFRCDFEILTDRIASEIGLLRAFVTQPSLRVQLQTINTLVYHANPTLRTKLTVTQTEVNWLATCCEDLQGKLDGAHKQFVLPQGCTVACHAHLLRTSGKQVLRMLYRHAQQGHVVPPLLIDFFSLISSYFFLLSLSLNKQADEPEIPFISRNYTSP